MPALRPGGKILLGLLVIVALFIGYNFAKKQGIIPEGKGSAKKVTVETPEGKKISIRPMRVCVVTWPGYAGGQYFNGGFKPSTDSRYFKEYGDLVEFIVIDDFAASRQAWIAGEVDLLWVTADAFPTEVDALRTYNPKIVFQADWSYGGDAIVAIAEIKSVRDLKGRKVAVAIGTPSHSFLLWNLGANDMSVNDIEVVEAPSATDAATYFKTNQVDAAVVWSPDDQDCINRVPNAHILTSTKQASNIIADVFFCKEEFAKSHEKQLRNLIEGWMKGAAEINTSSNAKEKAVLIMAEGLGQPEEIMRKVIDNVRLCTYEDNRNFFGLNINYKGVTGEDLYLKTGKMYYAIGLAPQTLPSWRSITDVSFIQSIKLKGPEHFAWKSPTFTKPTPELATAPAFSTTRITVNFPVNSATLDDNAKRIIDLGFGSFAKTFASARVRIEGNTDNTGGFDWNKQLSYQRAQAVADYLVKQYQFDRNRFVIVGNGPEKPIADNATPEGRSSNRRTDLEFLTE